MAKIGKVCKEYMIKELSEKLKDKPNIFVTDCTSLGVAELEKLRERLKGISVNYVIIKNSLGKLALKNVKIESLAALIDGTIGLVLGGADPISTSKTLVKFSKDTGKLKIKGGLLDGKLVDDAQIKEISLLPPKEIILAMVFGGMKAPISGFVNVLEGTIRKFVYVINAIKNKRENK